MKLETFFEKFDQFADAPDAVAKMRELILESAIRGMLVTQNASDEPASELLNRIASAQAGRGRKLAALTPVGDDAYLQLPPRWEWTRLGNTGRIFNGDSVSETGKTELAKVADGLPFIATKDVGYGRAALIYDNGLKVPLGDPRFKVAGANAVLICAEGGSAGRKIGITERDICFGNKLFANEVHEGIHHRYVFYVYQAPTFFRQFAARMTGIIGGISRGEFLSLPIPLPPEPEQKRIVAKVDELMALCDRLEAQQQEREEQASKLARASLARFADAPTPANLDYLFHSSFSIPPSDLRKSVLTLAVQGLLVPHDAESADWETRKLKDLTTKIGSGSTPSGGKESYQEAGVPLIRSMNVHFGGFVRHGLAFLNDEQAEKLKNVTVKADDVLLNITGASIGRVATAPKDMEGARVNQHVCILRPTAEIIPPFLELFLASPVVQNLIDDVQVGATREALTKSMIEQFEIPVPSLAEQRRIVAKVEQLMALVDALETQLAASRATAANLLSALVAELTQPS